MNSNDDDNTTFLGEERSRSHTFETSSLVRKLTYDTVALQLDVKLNNGIVYRYFGVPEEVYNDFVSAPSAGRHFSTHFAKPTYKFVKLS